MRNASVTVHANRPVCGSGNTLNSFGRIKTVKLLWDAFKKPFIDLKSTALFTTKEQSRLNELVGVHTRCIAEMKKKAVADPCGGCVCSMFMADHLNPEFTPF